LRDAGDARLEIDEALAELARGTPTTPPATPPGPPPGVAARPGRRWLILAAVLVLAAFALGVGVQHLRDSPRPDVPAGGSAGWSGQFLLGGTTRAFGPRVSPDGQWLAFVVLHEGQGQVGVMKLGS